MTESISTASDYSKRPPKKPPKCFTFSTPDCLLYMSDFIVWLFLNSHTHNSLFTSPLWMQPYFDSTLLYSSPRTGKSGTILGGALLQQPAGQHAPAAGRNLLHDCRHSGRNSRPKSARQRQGISERESSTSTNRPHESRWIYATARKSNESQRLAPAHP